MDATGGEGEADTAAAEGSIAGAPIDGFPPAAWGDYEVIRRVGQGAMGTVYKARDRRRDRIVAVKFLRFLKPDAVLRLAIEARTLARVEHPNICGVYESAELQGRPYLVLQFVDGAPLHEAAVAMSLAEKIAVMRDVALAIHAAHERDIVHRDLKPSNVMVERTERGWHPFVVDFGLARETNAEIGLTRSETLLGTPQYMSPEQARRDHRAVDRRSDVYSLGATLYEVLTGRPPFVDEPRDLLLAQVIHEDPLPPRRLTPGLPVDLEIIALKCLAKDPAQRYASARALADDLARYLDREPILGRRASPWRRLRRRAGRHRALVASSLAVMVTTAGFGVRAWITAREDQARSTERILLAQRVGAKAGDLEQKLRTVYQLPLQDIRSTQTSARATMHEIAATPRGPDALDNAIIDDALGRGYLALHDWQRAADAFAQATSHGLTTPELHANRGLALGELYHRALDDARRSGDRRWLARRQQELEQQYLAPAVSELARSRGADDHTAYLDARIALYRRDFATAEKAALAVVERSPWRSEARKLAADAAFGAASAAFDRGDDGGARPALDRAEALYARARDASRSDPSIYQAATQAALLRAELDDRRSSSSCESLERALDLIDGALDADPEDAWSYRTRAYVLLRGYQLIDAYSSGDQRPLLDRIAGAAERAVALDPNDASAWDTLGNAYSDRGTYESYHEGDGASWRQHAFDALGHALALRPNDHWVHNDLGAVHRWVGDYLEGTGGDPRPEYQEALRRYERAAEIDPAYPAAWFNQIDIHTAIAAYGASHGIDPAGEIGKARSAAVRCTQADPSFARVPDSVAGAELVRASYLFDLGQDVTDALRAAEHDLDQAQALQLDDFTTRYHRLTVARIEAEARLRSGADPTNELEAARAALAKALELYPGSPESHVDAARLDLVEARRDAGAHRNPAPALARAQADAHKAIELDRHYAEAWLMAAEVYLETSIELRSRTASADGIPYARRALALHPGLPRAQRVLDELERRSR